ncbi:hypothetical protein Hanom_Chr15g01340691 [Helianthus anomalus]
MVNGAVTACRREEEEREQGSRRERECMRERGVVGWGSCHLSTNHTFFFLKKKKSLPLHQMFKPLPTFFTKI